MAEVTSKMFSVADKTGETRRRLAEGIERNAAHLYPWEREDRSKLFALFALHFDAFISVVRPDPVDCSAVKLTSD